MWRSGLFYLAAVVLLLLPGGLVHAGIAGKDPACVKGCGTELASCLSPCRPNAECFNNCGVLDVECKSLCEDEIQLCEGLCQEYNDSCIEGCPDMEEKDTEK